MDRFTRNYSIFLAVVVLAMLVWVFYEDPQVAALNKRLEVDAGLAAYPYRFRVFSLEDGVAVMGTPRSAEFPAFRALGILFPELANREQDDPELMQAQQEMASLQDRARTIVLSSDDVTRVRWKLDSDWLTKQGIPPGTY
jgi:hypothetical protein